MLYVGIEGQQQCGPLLDYTDASVPVSVNAALVPFGLSEPAFQVEVVLRPVGRVIPHKETGLTARHHLAHVLPGRGIAPVQLLL
jgi:hypothetical protein